MSGVKNAAPKVTVVVVARNEAGNIVACMTSLAHQDYPGLEVVLVDDGSTDDTVALAEATLPQLTVISSPTRSISANRNAGWRAARSEFVAFLDADCEAPVGWVSTLVETAMASDASAVGGGNRPPSDAGRHYSALAVMLNTFVGSRGSVQGRVPTEACAVDHLPGLNVLYRREVLELVDGFDERFARMGEDEDLSRRIRALGLCLLVTPDATVIHKQRSDLASWAKNMRGYGRGRTWLIRRHPNIWSPVFLLPSLALMLMPFYLPMITVYALLICLQARDIWLWPRVAALFVATHLSYALGQIEGLITPGDNPLALRRSRRVALVALKNAGNKGDEAIAACVSTRLAEELANANAPIDLYLAGLGPSGFDVRPLPASGRAIDLMILDMLAPSNASRDVRVTELMGDALRAGLVFASFRAVVIAGGQWLHDLSLAKHVAVSAMFAFARAFGTATGVFCIGAGPLRHDVSRWLFRRGFGPNALLITRDDRSTALLKAAGRDQTLTAADPALALQSAPVETPTGRYLVSPCAWANFENLYALDQQQIDRSLDNWKRLADGLRARGKVMAVLPTMNPEDLEFARRIAAVAPGTEVIDTSVLTPAEVQGHIAKASALISMRLHPIIFASNCCVPFVALNYADKVKAYCAQLHLEDRLIDDLSGDWTETVLAMVETLSEDASADDYATARRTQTERLDAAYVSFRSWLNEMD